MKKINLKVRIKNAYFWLTFIPALVSFIYTVLSIFDIVPGIDQGTIIEILTAIVTALSTLGVLIDPTTEGVFDSTRALAYEKPASTDSFAEDDNGVGE